jgi:hypothetical protein
MMRFSVIELILVTGAFVAALHALRPYVPAWAWFTLTVGWFFLYWLVQLLGDGPRVFEGVMTLATLFAAAFIWWTQLRGTPPVAWRKRRSGRP